MKRLALLWIIVVFFGTSCLEAGQKSPTSKKDYLQDFDPAARWDFDGLVGRRVECERGELASNGRRRRIPH